MHILDEYIKNKFLQDISTTFEQYNIEKGRYTPTGNLLTRILETKFCEQFFKIYTEHYKRNFTILEVLANKQNLDIERQVFRIVRDNINIYNTTLTISHLINLYYSHKDKIVVNTPEKLAQVGVRINLERTALSDINIKKNPIKITI